MNGRDDAEHRDARAESPRIDGPDEVPARLERELALCIEAAREMTTRRSHSRGEAPSAE